ncbi:MAG TPA: response regulator transcription factor [Candidatus Acidoferrum sp.]|nr:response regulator transcription factor [Candidatus Acidoferrum sp.]
MSNSSTRHSICIVHKIKLVRDSIAGILAREADLKVIGDYADEREIMGCVPPRHPDVILLDITRAGVADNIAAVARACPLSRIVVWGVAVEEEAVAHCAGSGVSGYITCDDDETQWVQAVRGAIKGEISNPRIAGILNRYVAKRMMEWEQTKKVRLFPRDARPQPKQEPGQLTVREEDVLKLIDRGLSNKEIARELNVELSTIKNHVHSILNKLQVSRRIMAAAEYRALNIDALKVEMLKN